MGTPDFAVKSLEAILQANYTVVGVITAPDRPAGRGRKLQQSAVKKFALERGFKVLQPTNLKSEEFQKELQTLQANVQVVVAFRMLPKSIWNLPKFGTFNLHASLLPQYRGAAPINWAIINGETKTGVSTFFIDDKIDTGDMILQEEISISPTTNAQDLHDKLMHTGAALVTKTLDLIKTGELQKNPQKELDNLRAAPKLNKSNTRIDWSQPLEKTYNLIRGLDPYPAAWSVMENASEELIVKIFKTEKLKDKHEEPIGNISIEQYKLKVAVPGGYLIIHEIQLPGKRKMDTRSLLNGFNLTPNAKMR